ncbi:mannitol dehydrogenase family protein [Thalassospira tepidiphila]|uniref:mannitol dehydrogenase family protein n=1 Tax=Thalassospira tepidiphila TaxID=393657 RepID=UPI003AA8F61A
MTHSDASDRETDLPLEGAGIVHIGIGAFHRAHQAVYTHDAMAALNGDWHIIGVSLRSTEIVDALNAQGCAFSVIERHPDGPKARKITSMTHALAAARDVAPVLAALANPAIRIVTITVTEKAYGIDRSGKVQRDHAAIKHDLENIAHPSGLVGILVAGLKRRKDAGLRPFTIVSCDNLPANGHLLRAGVIDFAQQIDPGLGQWIAEHVSFPSTMVDRITPAATAQTFADAKRLTGHDDPAAIETEPFSQWVIEDDFPDGRPAWEQAGAILVKDVEPYELMKLRMLNGSHSLIAYVGQLGGYRYVRDAMANDMFAKLVARHMENAAASMTPLPGIDFADYGAELVDRFRNPEIAHETRQIAMDGTEKLPQRIFAPALQMLNAPKQLGTFALCFAAWLAVMRTRINGADASEAAQTLNDPRAGDIVAALGDDQEAATIYDRLAHLQDWMPEGLKESAAWREAVIARLSLLLSEGADHAIAQELAP